MDNKKIYQILTGNSEDEYYTYITPKFKDDEYLVCNSVILKHVVDISIVGKVIEVFYASEATEDKEFALREGVVIKSLDAEKVNWITRTQVQAEELLKNRELEVYRDIIPKLLARTGVKPNIYNDTTQQAQKPVVNKNLFIE